MKSVLPRQFSRIQLVMPTISRRSPLVAVFTQPPPFRDMLQTDWTVMQYHPPFMRSESLDEPQMPTRREVQHNQILAGHDALAFAVQDPSSIFQGVAGILPFRVARTTSIRNEDQFEEW